MIEVSAATFVAGNEYHIKCYDMHYSKNKMILALFQQMFLNNE